MKKLIFALILSSLSTMSSGADDPFKNITLHKFKNGLKVILAPDPKSEFVQVKVNVGVGFVHETKSNYGVSHLLEHMLFRNSNLKDDMSYLQLIQEKNGTANGTTTWDRTSYYATVKHKDGDWIMKTIHDMIMKPTMNPKHVETEKKTVLLEIGEPSPFAKALGIDIIKTVKPDYLDNKDFWEEYFNVKIKSSYSATEEQLSTLKLTKEQIVDHYQKYYDPSNMQIIVSGNINKDAVLAKLVDQWSSYPSRKIGDQRPRYKPKQPSKGAMDYSITSGTPRITLGFLVSEISVREKEVLLSYTEFLSHRLMKKLRNLHGETYTAHDKSYVKQNFGYVAVTLQSSKDKFQSNFDTIKQLIQDEAVDGKMTDEDVKEAKRLYLNRFVHWSQNASGSGKMAERMFEMNEYEGIWETPFEILDSVTPQQYRLILQKFAQRNLKYEMINHPELFFYMDQTVFAGLFCLFCFFLFRNFLMKPFKNDRVSWVRKVRYPPMKMAEVAVGGLILIGCIHSFLLTGLFFDLPVVKSLKAYGDYFQIPIIIFAIIATAQAIISFFPRKLYLMQDMLVIKSMSYFSRRIHKSEIKSIKAVSPFKIRPHMLVRMWNSYFYFDIMFWKKGLLVELKSGKMYFFSTKDSELCVKELRGLLTEEKKIEVVEQEAA